MARFQYRCSQCGGSVSKKSVGKQGKIQVGLHGWQCSKDGAVSVKRTINRQEDATA